MISPPPTARTRPRRAWASVAVGRALRHSAQSGAKKLPKRPPLEGTGAHRVLDHIGSLSPLNEHTLRLVPYYQQVSRNGTHDRTPTNAHRGPQARLAPRMPGLS